MSTPRKLVLLGALYLAQGLPYGFFTQALPVLLREMGVSLEDIGLASLLALPWALKFVWAPAVDRTATPRRWILALQLAATLLALGLAALNPTAGSGLKLMLVAVLVTNLVAATQDIATDGLAVALLHHKERGLGNGVQVAGYRVGMILGGGLLLVVFDHRGWAPTLVGMSAFIALASLPLLSAPDVGSRRIATKGRTPPVGQESPRNPWSWVQRPGALGWIAVLIAFKFGDYLAQGMLRPWMVDSGLSKTEIGLMLGTAGFTAGLFGAVLGGLLVNPLGRRRALVVFGFAQTLGVATYAACITLELTGTALWGAVIYEHLAGGMATAALFTAMMDASRTEHGATDYTLQASIVVLASGAASALSGFGAKAYGYDGLFALGAGLSVLAPVLAAIPTLTAITRVPESER